MSGNIETKEPRSEFNARTGRTLVWKKRDEELARLIVPSTGKMPSALLSARTCPCCGWDGREWRYLWHKEGLQYVQCVDCGLVYINPHLKLELLEEGYESGELIRDWLKTLQAQEDLDTNKFRKLLEDMLLLMPVAYRDGATTRVLDVGCSYGLFPHIATKEFHWYSVGLELSKEAVELKRQLYGDEFSLHALKLEDFAKRWENIKKFHAVTFWEVLEHVPDPNALLKVAFEMLAPRGVLGVMVPNLDARTNRILHEKSRAFGANHLQYWNARTLDQQLRRAGFVTETMYTMIADVNTWYNHMNYRDPYQGELVHPLFTTVQNAVLDGGEGYKLVAFARRP